jgi:pimeloyl-ACP methyl ester carboxylesterase
MSKHLIFLHGALGCKRDWNFIQSKLILPEYSLHYLDFPNHGEGKKDPSCNSLEALSVHVMEYIQSNALKDVILIGYSLGGYVALNLARRNYYSIIKVITIATKMNWNAEIAHEEASKLGEEQLMRLEKYLSVSHGDNWRSLIPITQQILISIGNNPIHLNDFIDVNIPIAMARGENDSMLTVSETTDFCNALINGKFIHLKNQGHLLQKMDSELLANEILRIL